MVFKACLFDMNGVLVDDEILQEQAFRLTLGSYGLDLSSGDYKKYFIGKTDKNGFETYFANRILPDSIERLINKKGEFYKDVVQNKLRGYNGVEQFIVTLWEKGLVLAVVTSSTRAEADIILNFLKLQKYFSTIIAAENVKNGKPDPEGYLKGAEALQVSPSKCMVVEDAPSGLQAAKSAGMYSVGVTNTHSKYELKDADIITHELSTDLAHQLAGL